MNAAHGLPFIVALISGEIAIFTTMIKLTGKMKHTILLVFVTLPFAIFAQYGFWFKDKALRIDYLHSGDANKENYELVEFVKEKYWGGSKTILTDHRNYGNYKIEVRDLATGNLLYSRGYSTLFNEWQATAEAENISATFYESALVPYPRIPVKIFFFSRNDQLEWERKFLLHYNPDKTSTSKHKDHNYRTFKVHKSGKPSEKLDIVMIPEGYTKKEMKKFLQDCNRFKEYLLNCPPYDQVKDKINIWGVKAASEESGTDIPGKEVYKNTLLNTTFNTFGSERYLTTADMRTVRDVASNKPYDQIVILVNHTRYGGGGFYNFYTIASSDNARSKFLLQHEFGHGFAGLGDEYYTSDVAVEDYHPVDKEPWEPNITTLVNFESKWKDMVHDTVPIPTPAEETYKNCIGVFEGGGYMEKGVYRPYMDCTMKTPKPDNFCPVCQQAILDMIKTYSK